MAITEKVSITLERELLEEARRYASENLSGWIGEAVRERIFLERGREWIRERERERGPLDSELLEDIRRRWRESSSTPDR